jgi:glycerol-3-phosphate acyltransferase PlsX
MRPVKIAVDAMGGDYAPANPVEGALMAVEEGIADVILVGREGEIRKELERIGREAKEITVVQAEEVIEMDESPTTACRQKKNSSIMVATNLLKEGKADAMVSAGNTGAVMVASLFVLGRIEGVSRPALVTILPHPKGSTVLLDAGANVDCNPHHLVQFAIMGSLMASEALGIESPRVGLLSNGQEKGKGNEVTLAAHSLLEKTPLRFVGNVEGRDVFNGNVDVVVCDGFVGNAMLKFGEGLAEAFLELMRREIMASVRGRIGAWLIKPALRKIMKLANYEEYGGAPLLGVNGVCFVCHGASSARAIKNAIRASRDFVLSGLNEKIKESIRTYGGEGVE